MLHIGDGSHDFPCISDPPDTTSFNDGFSNLGRKCVMIAKVCLKILHSCSVLATYQDLVTRKIVEIRFQVLPTVFVLFLSTPIQ
jgi:hypothetical protein